MKGKGKVKLPLLVAGVSTSIGITMVLAGTLLFVGGGLQTQDLLSASPSTISKAVFETSKSELSPSSSAPFAAIEYFLPPVSILDNDLNNDGNVDNTRATFAVALLLFGLPSVVLGLLSLEDNLLTLALWEVSRLSSIARRVPERPG